MFRLFLIAVFSFISVVPFLVLFYGVLSLENDLAVYISFFLAWVVTPVILLRIWKTKSDLSDITNNQERHGKDNEYDPMDSFPFSKAELPENEIIEWIGCNPTFHRSGHWGIIISNNAVYYHGPFWSIFSKWKRYHFTNIESIHFKDSSYFPMLVLQLPGGVKKLRTQHDYKEEMDFDRKKLIEACRLIESKLKNA